MPLWEKTPVQVRRSAGVSAILVAILAVGATAGVEVSKSAQTPSPVAVKTPAIGFKCSAEGSSATAMVPVAGASTNGTRDDSDVIQNAIDLAGEQGGGVVALPAGTFMINSHLVLKDNVKLTGVGPATVIKAGPDFLATQGPGGGYSLISTAGASNTTVANLTADQSGNTLDGNVPARLTGYVVEGYYSRNVLIEGVYVRNPFTYAIAMVDSTDFCVDDNNVVVTTSGRYNQLDGIHILDSNSGQVINNFVESGDDGLVAHTIGTPTYNILYANNKVRGGIYTDGIQLAVGDFPIYDITIEDNDFYGSLFGIRVGYYDDQGTGVLYDTTISENYIHNLVGGTERAAIEIVGSVAPGTVRGITVINNRVCDAGKVTVVPGPGNIVKGTAGCRGKG